ncbi:hypothetical protein K1719_030363 [Acacia pycnantha]|nr:hypothetical protein K1719_030363 [Acacia pycnantha]
MALTSAPSSCTPPSSIMKYHVFLSFRGEDTRTNFTDHLYFALLRKGIVTFRDDEELQRGEVISEKLIKAIEQSLFSVVILSQHYASSSWCLDELEKIIESKQDLGQTVFPVFYGVDPSDIRHQKRNFATAFEKHEGVFSNDKVRRWREALTTVANLSGWDTKNRHEAEIVEDIAKFIWNKLCDKFPSRLEHLVGDIQSKA